MGYASGAKKTWEIIEDIADELIATPGGYWTDGDVTWTTTDKTGNNARRCLHYLNGTEELYVALEQINQTSGINYYYNGSYWYYSKGIRIVISASWDSVGHTYPPTNQSTFIPFTGRYNAGAGADLATMVLTYYLWIESNGFVLFAKPEPHSDEYQQSFFTVLERNPNKEYSDGYTNFYVMSVLNYNGGGQGSTLYDGQDGVTSINRSRVILRPFAYQYPDTPTRIGTVYPSGNGVSFVPTPSYYAYKSSGNGKAYYVKPIIQNIAGSIAPIFQSELWFPWSETVGLIDGDVIAVEGQTTKFLCKALDSPDTANRLNFAIKYVA
jgi:hypothetical protein